MLSKLNADVRQYLLVTANYWAFTITDGALRMLVVLHFHQLGFSPLAIAMLFLFYEFFGVVTNLVGGWLGARIGLNRTMNIGLGLQVIALALLLVPAAWLTVAWVMAAQAISGIAKDLNKMSAKSAIKQLVPNAEQEKLFRWVALLTGSKNALKGVGFFLGGLLLATVGFDGALITLLTCLAIMWLASLVFLQNDLGRLKGKPKFREIFSTDKRINTLAAARLFLFAARDVWFVVALPVFLTTQLNWSHTQVGTFFALWIIGYGAVQSFTPRLLSRFTNHSAKYTGLMTLPLVVISLAIALSIAIGWQVQAALIFGLLLFGIVFAINSAWHSYLILSYSRAEGTSMDVGFYYTANAVGRLLGTVLSGWIYQLWGLSACLAVAASFIVLSALLARHLPQSQEAQ